jgi:hypothetical protein
MMEFKSALREKLADCLEKLKILENRIIELNNDFNCDLSSAMGSNEEPAVHVSFHKASTVFSVADKELYRSVHEKMLNVYNNKMKNLKNDISKIMKEILEEGEN